MWLCGGVSVNYHSISDFRSGNAEFFEKMLTDSVTAMLSAGFVTLKTIGQDGMRVRANAGGSSFRRKPKLEELHQAAKTHVKKLREESEDDSQQGQSDSRRKAAQQRAATERAKRIAESIRQVEELHDQKEKRKKGDGEKARCSTTDPDARRMKMGDGGYRPAYNFQFATDGESRMIVAVDVTNSGSDRGEMAPMREKVVETYHQTPEQMLVDSAFATKADVKTAEAAGTSLSETRVHAAKLRVSAYRSRVSPRLVFTQQSCEYPPWKGGPTVAVSLRDSCLRSKAASIRLGKADLPSRPDSAGSHRATFFRPTLRDPCGYIGGSNVMKRLGCANDSLIPPTKSCLCPLKRCPLKRKLAWSSRFVRDGTGSRPSFQK